MTTLQKAIDTYGKDMQLNVAVEEFSELIKEICKNKRGRDNINNIIEEMADCYIMLEQLTIIFGIKYKDINDVIDEKLARLENMIAERSENGKQAD
jgi:NTP pyrophosphatase (non-canonical NTP hydrolase)